MPSLAASHLLSRQKAKLRIYVLHELILCGRKIKPPDRRYPAFRGMSTQMREHRSLHSAPNYATAHQPCVDLENAALLDDNHEGDEAMVGETIT